MHHHQDMNASIRTEKEKSAEYLAIVDRLSEMFRNWVEMGVDLFLELHRVELSGVWKELHPTFEAFLRHEFPNALGILQYEHVIESIELHGLDWVRRWGVHSCSATVHKRFREEPEKLEQFHRILAQEAEKTNTFPDADRILKIRKGLLEETHPPTRAQRELEREDAASDRLQAALVKIRALEGELASAKKKIAELEARLAKPNRKSISDRAR